jgi:hypothetical protein
MAKKRVKAKARKFDARPDRADYRDKLYEPGLHYVPPTLSLTHWRRHRVPVLDQGEDGACTGFGLAVVANFLMRRKRMADSVSPRMLYEMAKKYDEWPGEDYEGSSCKGAMKGWHRHGVCLAKLWPHADGETEATDARLADAAHRPLGAYYRVNVKNLMHMHAALAEVGCLYVSADVHDGWWTPKADGTIADGDRAGGHAFALVGYDEVGFWLQNSWGRSWGLNGCARLPYDQWLRDGFDAWVCRAGVPTLVGP